MFKNSCVKQPRNINIYYLFTLVVMVEFSLCCVWSGHFLQMSHALQVKAKAVCFKRLYNASILEHVPSFHRQKKQIILYGELY